MSSGRATEAQAVAPTAADGRPPRSPSSRTEFSARTPSGTLRTAGSAAYAHSVHRGEVGVEIAPVLDEVARLTEDEVLHHPLYRNFSGAAKTLDAACSTS